MKTIWLKLKKKKKRDDMRPKSSYKFPKTTIFVSKKRKLIKISPNEIFFKKIVIRTKCMGVGT